MDHLLKMEIAVDTCGEILIGDSGRISYKLGKEYELNERCTWVVKSKSKSSITVQLMADGFESCCDGLKINKMSLDSGTIDSEGISMYVMESCLTYSTL